MTSPKISVYSLSDLKNTTDDALPNYLTSLKFQQSHYLADVRLGLGYSAVVIAAVTFYADYKLGWDATKVWTMWAVIAYFILNGALTYWIWVVEKAAPFTRWFDSEGYFVAAPFQRWLASEIPPVKEADSQKAGTSATGELHHGTPYTQGSEDIGKGTKASAEGTPPSAARSRKSKKAP
ncbi:MAG: hypothetical protein Q9170_000381 [Blastenia crenularia]